MTTTVSPIYFENIPHEFKALSHWINWDGDKSPVDARTGDFASSTNSSTWYDYELAKASSENYSLGIAFVLIHNAGTFCLDVDHCYFDGMPSPLAQKFMRLFPSYTEISNGGDGIHIFGFTDRNFEPKAKKIQSNEGKYEFYTGKKYICITGNLIGDERELNYFPADEIAKFTGGAAGVLPQRHTSHRKPQTQVLPTTREERRIADSQFNKNPTFKALWQGDFSKVDGDLSRVDFRIACVLNESAVKSYPNEDDRYAVIRKLMLSNKHLIRDKWLVKNGVYNDYLERVIMDAMSKNKEWRNTNDL